MVKSLALHALVVALLLAAPHLQIVTPTPQPAIQAYLVHSHHHSAPAPKPAPVSPPAEVAPPTKPVPHEEPKPAPKPVPKVTPTKPVHEKPVHEKQAAPAKPLPLPVAPVKHALARPEPHKPLPAAPAKPEEHKPAPKVDAKRREEPVVHKSPPPDLATTNHADAPPRKSKPPLPAKAEPVSKPTPPKATRLTISADDIDSELLAVNRQAAALKQQQRQQQLDALRSEAAASTQALADSANKAIVQEYLKKIQKLVFDNWDQPPAARDGMVVVLHIRLSPAGDVSHVEIVQSSHSEAFDNSAVEAVYKASPLPVPRDSDVFNGNFRSFNLKLNHKDQAP